MAKITLIQPPNPFLTTPTMYFPLGLLYIAAVLENAHHQVKIADLRAMPQLSSSALEESFVAESFLHVLLDEADFYGVTATSSLEIADAKAISQTLKELHPKAVTIIGGSHASILPEDCTNDFDVVVVGEGEEAILDIVDGGVRGIVQGGFIKDLDALPYPARHLLPEKAVFSSKLIEGEKYGEGPKATTTISSRGCPYSCAFCSQPHFVRYRSPELFVNEVKFLQDRFGCQHFRFVDDAFTLNKERLFQICLLLQPLNVHYRAQTRADLVTDEMCKALRASGCDELAIGVESADNQVLKTVNKSETDEDMKQAVQLIKASGMRAKTYWMTGLPKETWLSIELNKLFMKEVKPDRWTLSMFAPFPGCNIERNPEKYGVKILNRDYNLYGNFSKSFIQTDVASNEELNLHYQEFYKYLVSEEWKNE